MIRRDVKLFEITLGRNNDIWDDIAVLFEVIMGSKCSCGAMNWSIESTRMLHSTTAAETLSGPESIVGIKECLILLLVATPTVWRELERRTFCAVVVLHMIIAYTSTSAPTTPLVVIRT